MSLRQLPIAIALVLLVLGGLLHGSWTNRWGDSRELTYSATHMPKLPMKIGKWEGKDLPPTEDQLRSYTVAELRVAVVREYTNRETGDRVLIMAVCGPPGPIGTHTPESCYGGAGMMAYAPQVSPFSLGGKQHDFMSSDFRTDARIHPTGLKIYWAYRPGAPGSRWQASNKPRADFAPYRALYKVYVIRNMAMPGPSPVADDVTPGFISELIPSLEQSVFADLDATGA
jgi:hypothetical protein